MGSYKPKVLGGFPPELIQMVAENLDAKTLKSFRLSCRQFANAGLKPIEDHVSEDIVYPTKGGLDGPGFVQSLILDLQDRMPRAARNVKTLEMHNAYRPHMPLIPSLYVIKLPSLRVLDLTGVAVTKGSLRHVLQEHKSTLKNVELTDVALALSDIRKFSSERKLRLWISLMSYVRKHLALKQISLNCLCWYDAGRDVLDKECVETPQAKYHPRFLDPEHKQWFKMSNGAVIANGTHAVKDGLKTFAEEVANSTPDNCRMAMKTTRVEPRPLDGQLTLRPARL